MSGRLTIPVLLLALLPSFLDGMPLYLCRITGVESLVQRCAKPSREADCPHCAVPERAVPPRMESVPDLTPGSASRVKPSSCCAVSVLRWVGAQPASAPVASVDLDGSILAAAKPTPSPLGPIGRVGFDLRAGPTPGRPLFLWNLSFLC